MEKDNIIDYLKHVPLGKGVGKNGNPYTYLDLVFVNGYKKRVFLNEDSLFGIKDALSQSPVSAGLFNDGAKVDS